MKVQEKYYNLLKAGIKTIELRLYDDKRKNIKIGDEVLFENLSDREDTFTAEVKYLYRAPDFRNLAEQIPVYRAGLQSKEELIETMAEFYPLDRQKEKGVLGIEIKTKK